MKGHVAKKGKKFYVVVDIGVDPNTGKRKQKWFSGYRTKKEAQAALTEKLYQLQQGTYVEPTKLTLKEYLTRWLNDYAKINCAPKTYEGYELIVTQHINPNIGKIQMDKLQPMDIQNYYSRKLANGRLDGKGGLSARTVLHHHRVIHEALEHAVKWRVIPINPAKAVNPPKAKKTQFNVLNKEQVHTLLEAAYGRSIYEILYFTINTGMRRGEIFGLRWKDVNFEKHTLSIRQTLQKTKKEGYFFRPTTKTDGSRRSIAVSEALIQMLKKIQLQQKYYRSKFGSDYQDLDLVFSKPDGSHVSFDSISKKYIRLVKKLDIPYVRFHDLRHTHATLMLQQGEHPKVVSERLVHSTITLTMDTYSHVLPNMQKEAARRLDDFLFGK